MLVLARRLNDKIVFPTLGISVEIVKIAGATVRVGVEAPRNVPVLRHEVAERMEDLPALEIHQSRAQGPSHALRDRLQEAKGALHLLRRQLEAGLTADAGRTLDKAVDEFATLEQELDGLEKPSSVGGTALPRALLVDDDADESEFLASLLRLNGFNVDTACDGYDALDYLSSHHPPDIILLDMLMPRCDGPTTVSAIRANPRYEGLKVFAVSAASPESLGVMPGPGGCDRWFRKPVNPESLVREISRELTLARSTA